MQGREALTNIPGAVIKILCRPAMLPNINGESCCQMCSEERPDIFFTISWQPNLT